MIYIDTNEHLFLYKIPSGRALIKTFLAHRRSIFVSRQIALEVERNKLRVAAFFLGEELKKFILKEMAVPDHLMGVATSEAEKLREKLKEWVDKGDGLKAELASFTSSILEKISHSQDDVSLALRPLFEMAVKETEEERQRARTRRELGDPPGKPGDPLGDQLSWEQFLTHSRGISKLWIFTTDGDFYTKYNGACILNPRLYRDLQETHSDPFEVHVFDNLMEGFKDFVERSMESKETLPTAEESKEIEKEVETLPRFSPTSGVVGEMSDISNLIAARGVSGYSAGSGGVAIINGPLGRWVYQAPDLPEEYFYPQPAIFIRPFQPPMGAPASTQSDRGTP